MSWSAVLASASFNGWLSARCADKKSLWSSSCFSIMEEEEGDDEDEDDEEEENDDDEGVNWSG